MTSIGDGAAHETHFGYVRDDGVVVKTDTLEDAAIQAQARGARLALRGVVYTDWQLVPVPGERTDRDTIGAPTVTGEMPK